MAGMAVDGLVSGINTTEMIGQLMQLEAAPQTLLKSKVTKAESLVSALQSLNTKLSSLKDSAAKAASATSWQAVTASSSTPSVTATAAGTALPSTLTFTVDRVATRQTSVSGNVSKLADFVGTPPPTELTLMKGKDAASATFTKIDLTDVTDLPGLAGAINKAGAGVSATLVTVNGATKVQLTGKDTGDASAFDLHRGAVTATTVSGATRLLGRGTAAADNGPAGGAAITVAQDAKVTLWSGTAAASEVTSASNTFKDVVAGVSFTVSAVETDPLKKSVTVTVGRDDAALKKLGSDLVTNIGTVLSEVASRTKVTTTTSSDGRQVVSGGVLSADSATRQVRQSVTSAASLPVSVDATLPATGKVLVSPATVGINLAKDGTFSFDESKFSAALVADPVRTQKVLTEIATRVEKTAKDLSDPTVGSLSQKIKGQQSLAKNLSEQVDNWDSRLALRRRTLERTYSSLEVSLSNINSQANWLTSQLESLSANK
ncbi:flagellar filament capping protein FliD [Cellulomonas aerilata]|uniref:Flagellar hook-associated protein 2 n=1 Tax=Cellulomonas aerilata TaxID=515326 RepID=A0A512DDB1_9CELL|nr:flagellar filament capping protein FliD [Cellulomonas aerilata]GEO34469.1 B-type flagellar hook-associated protein 2 [Cellulomonas aerilata]